MSKTEALILSVIAGLAALLLIAVVVLLVVPDEVLFPQPTPTITPTLAPTATPTFPNFLPTPSFETPVSPEPSPTNTRVPTASPIPTRTPTPTVTGVIGILTPFVRPTDTPLPTIAPPPTAAIPTNTPIPGRQYAISFDAAKTTVANGECTDLRWRVEGPATVQLDGQVVPAAGARKVCPNRNTTYSLTIQIADSAQIERRTVTIAVN
jgi:hypothetical protein